MSRTRPRSHLAHSSTSQRQPGSAPAPGRRPRTASLYADGAGGQSGPSARSGAAGQAGAARPSNLDFAMLPPEVHAEEALSRASRGAGQPLPEDLAARFSDSLGADLGAVRIHTGSDSVAAARAVGAKAYAIGQDIHFAAGQYDPTSAAGQHLMAHEVAHTVQQAGGTATRQNKLEVSSPGDAHEVEADRAASAMVDGQPTTITTSTHGGVSRFWDEVEELFGWGEEEVVATKTPTQPAPAQPAQPAYPAQPAAQDIEVERASQDLAISQQNLEMARQAHAAAGASRDQAQAALDAAKEHHSQVASDGAAGIPGTQANQRLAEAERRTQAAQQALDVATRTVERTESELRDAEANERVMYANLEAAKRNAAARGQSGAAEAGGQEEGSFWDAFGW